MNIHPLMFIGAYILIGIFVASAVAHSDNQIDDSFDVLMLCILFWPIIAVGLVLILIFCIPYILGKWTGHLLHDLLR